MILGWLGSLLGGPFAKAAVEAYQAKLTAENSAEKIAADLKAQELSIQEQREQLQQQIILADQGSFVTRLMRPAFAYPIAAYYGKIFLIDKVFKLGVTDQLTPELHTIAGIVITGIFGSYTVETAMRVWARKQ
jgi:drug/metabolite transporter superfamily protein YnfA